MVVFAWVRRLPAAVLDRLRNAPYWVRFFFLVLATTLINILGLFATEKMGWSLIFFDMIGTAIASLLSGAAAGMLTAILSSALGSQYLGSIDYLVFGYVNLTGSLVWSMLPRTGKRWFGCFVFDPSKGLTYLRAFLNILVLGLVAGVVTSLSAWVINEFVLAGSQKYMFGSTTMVGYNNSTLARGLTNIVQPSPGIAKYLVDIASSLITSVPDKIIATAVAVFVIVSYRTLPNYKEQKDIIRRGNAPEGMKIVGNKIFLMLMSVIISVILPYAVWMMTSDIAKVFYMVLLAVSVMLVILPADVSYTRSLDRPYLHSRVKSVAFYEVPKEFHLGHHKAVFEDLLKLMAVAVSGISFLIALRVNGPCVPETATAGERCGPLYELAAVNALIVTGFRYVCVVIMRLGNRN